MELIAAVLFAFPLGRWLGSKRGLIAYVGLWAAVFPIQTFNVQADSGLDGTYYIINAVILTVGIAVNRWGARRADRRASRSPVL